MDVTERAAAPRAASRSARGLLARLLLPTVLACAQEQGASDAPRPPVAPAAESAAQTQAATIDGADAFTMRVVAEGLAAPWEISWGPDDFLWITERAGKRVVRVDPESGARTTALQLDDVHRTSGQDGLLGMALHPLLLAGRGSDFVYLVYTYDADPGPATARRTKLVRYTYAPRTQKLSAPVALLTGLPASHDHNAGRLRFGPDGRLYLTVGDMGKNQFENRCQPVRAQELPTQEEVSSARWDAYEGKILRIDPDGAIPSDNPVLAGVRSHVYAYGHRNPQGLALASSGRIYVSEHGPKTDDELNLIEAGKNYGWPHVAGYRDGASYAYGNWSSARDCAELRYDEYGLPPSVAAQPEHAFAHPDFRPPLRTLYTVASGYDFETASCGRTPYICWPTVAPSSLELYEGGAGAIPGWGPALLVPSLKMGAVLRVSLTEDGRAVTGPNVVLFKTTNRYRDLALAPDQRTFYVVTDTQGDTSGPTQGGTQKLTHRGAVLAFRYAPREKAD